MWTSARLPVTPSQPTATIDIERTYAQLDPAADGDPFTIEERFAVDRKGFGPWQTSTTSWLGMGALRGTPANQNGEGSTYTVPYTGAPARALVVQVRITLSAERLGEIGATLHVTASRQSRSQP